MTGPASARPVPVKTVSAKTVSAGPAAFAAADWGTTRLRVWLMDDNGTVLAERRSDEGMTAAREGNRFGAILEGHLTALGAPGDLPVVACGMVGARQGWVEAPYVQAPAALDHVLGRAIPVPDSPRPVRIVPGMAQGGGGAPPDVMRGEETQLAGIRALLGTGRHRVCMPGTHSKWVEVDNGTVTRFATYLTGELFALLSERSILAHSVGTPVPAAKPGDPAFLEACRIVADGSDWAANLFAIRAGGLLRGTPPEQAAATLSGLLIGSEIVSARQRFGNGAVVLVASGAMAGLYAAALEAAGMEVTPADADEAVRAGLCEAARQTLGADPLADPWRAVEA